MRSLGATITTVALFVFASCPWMHGQDATADVDGAGAIRVRFAFVDVYVDAGDVPLAAYQLEIGVREGDVRVVGIEGGDHPAFREPPYYDPKALTQSRVILAAFRTGDDLPMGRTRIARVHLRIAGDAEPVYAVELMTAASRAGVEIPAEATIEKGAPLP